MLKVVVIDNNAVSRNLLTAVLTNGGHEVVGDANTSTAGLANMIKLRPQVVCIDVGQDATAGLEMLENIRSALPKSLLFLVSNSIDSATVENAVKRGVHGFIVKPFNAVTVLATIRNAVIKLARRHQANSDSGDVGKNAA